MTWKLYAVGSAGAFLATYLVSNVAPVKPVQNTPVASPRAVDGAGEPVDLTEQAERLRAGIAATTPYREPHRDAFRFGDSRRRTAAPPLEASEIEAPVVAPPPRPPFALAGVATDAPGGPAGRTAILSSLRGVLLVREGDLVEGMFRIVSIDADAITVERVDDGTSTTLRLSGSDSH
ncbi:MAG TPA: hypothetical protein VFO58_09290 [Vicinamibacterales bacterium]|nr:hypothetical protein [Vicinamibacterales bacterium]